MSIILSAVAFLVLLTVLVLIHECGHYFAAKEAGVTVEEFGFGLPPRALVLFVKAGTKFTLNWIPFGGFVRLKGESLEHESDRRARGSFSAAPVFSRIVILCAGVAMNFLFAIILFTVGFSVGRWIPTYLSYEDLRAAADQGVVQMTPGVLIDGLLPGGAAETVRVPFPSILLRVDDTVIVDPAQVSPLQEGKNAVTYTLLTGPSFGSQSTVRVPVRAGKTGVALRAFPRNLSAPFRSPWSAVLLSLRETEVVTVQTVIGIKQLGVSLFSRGQVPEGVMGIVGIAELTHESVREGFMTYLRLVALLSLSLAVLNILPLPALDGGRVAFVLLELIRRKPTSRRFEATTNMIGFFVLIGLILIITYHDILRLFF